MKVLIIEDDTEFLQRLAWALEGKQKKVDTASGGLEAQKKLEENEYDCILLDYCLGDHNGLDLLPSIKEKMPKSAIIMITAFATKELVIESLNRGVDRFLEKPFLLKDLEALLSELKKSPFARLRLSKEDQIEIGESTSLTFSEEKILDLFANSHSGIVTEDEISQAIESLEDNQKRS